MEDTLQRATESMRELEEREGEIAEREETSALKLQFIEGQLKDSEDRLDTAERAVGVFERNITETTNEIQAWKNKTSEIDEELECMDNVGNDMDLIGDAERESKNAVHNTNDKKPQRKESTNVARMTVADTVSNNDAEEKSEEEEQNEEEEEEEEEEED